MAAILVTGAAGFIGRALCPALAARGHRVVAGLRRPAAASSPAAGVEARVLGDIAPGREWSQALRDIDIVIHLAQSAHRPPQPGVLAAEPDAAAALARGAARAGARRFLYLSSIKAMGEATAPGRPFRTGDPPHPEDSYGRAKLASEEALAAVSRDTGIELVILRPPLVYGPGVGGNFRALARLAGSGLPLPLAAVDNRRSLLGRDNLIDAVATAASSPAAAGRVLLLSDATDFSVPALIRLLAAAQGRRARLFPLPAALLAAVRALPRLGPAAARLTLSLQVDASATRAALDWTPPVDAACGLRRAARALASGRGAAGGL